MSTREEDVDPGGLEAVEEVTSAFDRAVAEGAVRLNRRWPTMLASGFMAGLDVGLGVLALLFVEHETGSAVLGGLAFTVGFLALALGRGELFTENFLVPITTVVARSGSVPQLLRLWGVTYPMNLLGGWLVALLVVLGYPALEPTITEIAGEIVDRQLSLEAFMLAVLAGMAITLMTWMERNAESELGRLLSVVAFGFLIATTHMHHVVVISIKIFAGLEIGADYGYLDWLRLSSFAVLGNMLGGIGLVTVLRLVQVGRDHIERRQRATVTVRNADGSEEER